MNFEISDPVQSYLPWLLLNIW